MRNGREADFEHLYKALNTAKTPAERREILRSIDLLKRELHNPAIRSMREALIRETRAGRTENVKDIREEARKMAKYQNERW